MMTMVQKGGDRDDFEEYEDDFEKIILAVLLMTRNGVCNIKLLLDTLFCF